MRKTRSHTIGMVAPRLSKAVWAAKIWRRLLMAAISGDTIFGDVFGDIFGGGRGRQHVRRVGLVAL